MSKASNLAGFVPSIEPTNNLTVGNIVGVGATFTGNVSVGGTLTYEDVTNVDSVGLITARSGVNVTGGSVVVGSAVTLSSGGVNVVGVVTATSFVGNGSGLSSLDAGDISAGTLAIARGGTNSTATPTAGGAAYGTGSAFAFTSAGTSGQVLTSNGTSAPSWATPAGGAWQFISSVTASNSASVAFTSGLDSTYDVYAIVYNNLLPVTDNTDLQMRFSSNGGSSYISTGYAWSAQTDNSFLSSGGSSTHLYMNRTSTSVAQSAGTIMLYNVPLPTVTGMTNISVYGRGLYFLNSTGGLNSSVVINAIQFVLSSGNISTGTFRLYGIKNS